MVSWMRYQIFIPILLLHFINVFWSFLILRIAVRYVYRNHWYFALLILVPVL